jgi:alkanesulfonate monooxygenase SsuD/methylene tetrahydromethanopterin reductase-like flavin-dependent oxidoreductase (luciferase family)
MRANPLRLTALDVLCPANIPHFAQCLDAWGYYRYWATEHHSGNQSPCPILGAAVAAAVTSRIRIGTAGVLLNLYPSRKAAADLAMLHLLFGARVDCGIAGGVPPSNTLAQFLEGRPSPSFESYSNKVADVVHALRHERLIASSGRVQSAPPELWLCGGSTRSAELAARLNMSFSFHYQHYMNDRSRRTPGTEIVRSYRDAFRREDSSSPTFNIVCYGVCAENREEAALLWDEFCRSAGGENAAPVKASFLGDSSECRDQLYAIADEYEVDEIVIECCTRDYRERLRSYHLLAECLGLADERRRCASGGVDAYVGHE